MQSISDTSKDQICNQYLRRGFKVGRGTFIYPITLGAKQFASLKSENIDLDKLISKNPHFMFHNLTVEDVKAETEDEIEAFKILRIFIDSNTSFDDDPQNGGGLYNGLSHFNPNAIDSFIKNDAKRRFLIF